MGGCAILGSSAGLAALGQPEFATNAVIGGGITTLIGLGVVLKGRYEYIHRPDDPNREDLPDADIIPIASLQPERLSQPDEYEQTA